MSGFIDRLFGSGDDGVVRGPEFAGVQYAADADALSEQVDEHLCGVDGSGSQGVLRGVVAPYGDYEYAGPTMAAAYRRVADAEFTPRRILAIASSARVPFRGLAVAGHDAWETPLGEVPVDVEATQEAVDREMARPIEAAFEPAAALELQLPFLQRVAEGVPWFPVLVGDADVSDVAALLESFWDDETLLVVAGNLSEGFGREEAGEIDRETIAAIERGEAGGIGRRSTASRLPLEGMIAAREGTETRVELLDYRTSAETSGEADQVVGYAAFEITR